MSLWRQAPVTLAPRPRGIHLVTREILSAGPPIGDMVVGILHLFIQHTSASLALNENASPEVRTDLERWMRAAVPDGWPGFEHTLEGPDDMPAHVKAVIVGSSLSIPITSGRLALGTWQGIYLLEHRDRGGPRQVLVTACGGGTSASDEGDRG